jgi:hypothetical protein
MTDGITGGIKSAIISTPIVEIDGRLWPEQRGREIIELGHTNPSRYSGGHSLKNSLSACCPNL